MSPSGETAGWLSSPGWLVNRVATPPETGTFQRSPSATKSSVSPASAGWRAYLLPHLVRILDDYGVDGLYNDLGYIPLAGNPRPPTRDEVLAFEERADHDGALTDLLAIIYAEVKRRGGIAIYLTRWLFTPLALPTNLIAGSSGYPFWKFLLFDIAGEITWILLYGGLGYAFGSQ